MEKKLFEDLFTKKYTDNKMIKFMHYGRDEEMPLEEFLYDLEIMPDDEYLANDFIGVVK